jgi:hypothetical protein
MTTTWGLSYLYASISRILLTATRSYAICPQLKCVLAAARSASGGMTFSGQSATMAFQPLEITQDGTHFYVIGTTGVEKHTMAAVPVFANLFSFDAGLGRFIFSEGSYLVVPSGDGGVQTISRTTGVALASLPGVLSEIHAGCYDTANRRLWLFDQNRAKGVSIQVGTAGQLTYVSSFSIPNCRKIVRVVFDSAASLLFIINDHRIVRFSTAAWEELTVAADYGVNELTYTDFAKIGTNQYWIGTMEPSSADAVSGSFGQQFGAWDSVNEEMQIVCPKMALWTVNDAIPYWSITTEPEIVITPPPAVVPVIPVINSSLTANVIVGDTFTYTITATGTGPIYYDVVSPPSWLTTINHLTGVISGVPPGAGTTNLTITATNAGGTDTETLVVTTSFLFDSVGFPSGGKVYDMKASGDLLYLVGNFTSVSDANGTHTRNNVACLNLTTQLFTSFAPNVAIWNNAGVAAVDVDATYVYIGGYISAVNGTTRNNIARINASNGTLDATWNPNANSDVKEIHVGASVIWVGGGFSTIGGASRTSLAALSAAGTGTATSWVPTNSGAALTFYAVKDLKEVGGILYVGGDMEIQNPPGTWLAAGVAQFSTTTGYITAYTKGIDIAGAGTVFSTLLGPTSYLIGSFTQTITLPGYGAPNVARNCAADLTSSAVGAFNPNFDGAPSGIVQDANTDLFIGGGFTTVGVDATHPWLVRVNTSGAVVSSFAAVVNPVGSLLDVRLIRYGNWLLVSTSSAMAVNGGTTRAGFFVVDATTGASI